MTINTKSFFANVSLKASSPERKFAIDQAWRAFLNGQCNSPETLLEIITMEYTTICYENGHCSDYIKENRFHFANLENATKMLKMFHFVINS